jgi:long-chain fatty acid transport protein
MKKNQKIITALMLSALPGLAQATNVFNLEGFGAVSRGMGGTGVAENIGAPAMMYNPATLALMSKGTELHLGIDLITTNIDEKNTATGENASSGNHGNNRGPYFAPQLAYTQNDESLTFGVGVFAQGGLGTEYGSSSYLSQTSTNSVATGLDNSSRLLNLRIPFAAALKVNDQLTVGGSVDAVWTAMNLEMLLDVTQVGALAADGRVTGSLVPTLLGVPDLSGAHFSFTKNKIVGGGVDAWGLGAKLGMTYEVSAETRIGAAYNMKTRVGDLKGQATLTAVSSSLGNIPLNGDIVIRDFQNPAQFSVGISHNLNERVKLLFDFQRVFWKDVMKDIDVGFVDGSSGQKIDIKLPQNYDDINIYAIGAQYTLDNQWTLRGGYQHSDQALPGETTLAVIPAYLTEHLTAGFTYGLSDQSRLEFAYSHAFESSNKDSAQPATAIPVKSTHSQNNFVISYVTSF